VGLIGCGDGLGSPEATGPIESQSGSQEVLATFDDERITLEDIRTRIGDELDRMDAEFERARRRTIRAELNTVLSERLMQAEMRRRGLSLDELLAEEAGGSLDPTEEEIADWHEANRARLGGRSLEQAREQIATYLRNQRREQVAQRLGEGLQDRLSVRIRLEPYRTRFDNDGAPSKGPDTAPITLVEFSDFECPFCERFAQTLDRVSEEFGDTVQLAFRHFPLENIHAHARRAAEASVCAGEQGRFWGMHDLMFQEQDRLWVDDLRENEARLALDLDAFDACLESERPGQRVNTDQREGRRAGVNGTPTLFVNGVLVDGGPLTYEVIAAAIRSELQGRNP
jgi:predicted DsbA family dithiol-disulfide isomerase